MMATVLTLLEHLSPEPCLWSFFNDLVEAFLVLEYGTSEADKRIKSWKKIVHRDVKLDNVFLDIPGAKDNFPSYPYVGSNRSC
jgi:serine/threonine protein kinase